MGAHSANVQLGSYLKQALVIDEQKVFHPEYGSGATAEALGCCEAEDVVECDTTDGLCTKLLYAIHPRLPMTPRTTTITTIPMIPNPD